jgi:hypothetical protein
MSWQLGQFPMFPRGVFTRSTGAGPHTPDIAVLLNHALQLALTLNRACNVHLPGFSFFRNDNADTVGALTYTKAITHRRPSRLLS